jgi:hypothetical protein
MDVLAESSSTNGARTAPQLQRLQPPTQLKTAKKPGVFSSLVVVF